MAGCPRTGIFISHAHADADLAGHLSQLIQNSLGLLPDRITCTSHAETGLLSGEPLRKQIQDRLNSAAVLILLATKHSKGREWITWEASYAVAHALPLHVLITCDAYRSTIPDPCSDRHAVTLSNGDQTLALIERLAVQISVASPAIRASDIAAILDSAHADVLAHRDGLLAQQSERFTANARRERLVWMASLAAAIVAAVLVPLYLSSDFDHRLQQATQQHERELTAQNVALTQSHTEELRRFSLHGKVAKGRTPLRYTDLEVYLNFKDGTRPLATARTDVSGIYSFARGELDIDPQERVDFVVRVPAGPNWKKLSPIDARLDIDFE